MKKLKLEGLDSPTKDGEKVMEFLIKSCGIERRRITLRANRSADIYNAFLGKKIILFIYY